MNVTLEDTRKVISLMQSMNKPFVASYVIDMADRIATLEAEAEAMRDATLEEVMDIIKKCLMATTLYEEWHILEKMLEQINALRRRTAPEGAQTDGDELTIEESPYQDMRNFASIMRRGEKPD